MASHEHVGSARIPECLGSPDHGAGVHSLDKRAVCINLITLIGCLKIGHSQAWLGHRNCKIVASWPHGSSPPNWNQKVLTMGLVPLDCLSVRLAETRSKPDLVV